MTLRSLAALYIEYSNGCVGLYNWQYLTESIILRNKPTSKMLFLPENGCHLTEVGQACYVDYHSISSISDAGIFTRANNTGTTLLPCTTATCNSPAALPGTKLSASTL